MVAEAVKVESMRDPLRSFSMEVSYDRWKGGTYYETSAAHKANSRHGLQKVG